MSQPTRNILKALAIAAHHLLKALSPSVEREAFAQGVLDVVAIGPLDFRFRFNLIQKIRLLSEDAGDALPPALSFNSRELQLIEVKHKRPTIVALHAPPDAAVMRHELI